MDQPAALAPYAPLEVVRDRIAHAARIARRQPGEVTLVAVSKTHPAERIAPLLAAGSSGENSCHSFRDDHGGGSAQLAAHRPTRPL